ncbi:MAG: sterol desaturase family protein [Acidimicrobiales bacterium]
MPAGSGELRRRPAVVDLAVLAALVGLVLMAFSGWPGRLGGEVHRQLHATLVYVISAPFLILTSAILLLERLVPANPDQKSFTPSSLMDGFFTFFLIPATSAFAVALTAPVASWLDAHAGFLVVHATSTLPTGVAVGLGVLIGDFWAWFMHMLNHKIPLFWRFHVVHHSQEHLTFFTSNKVHPLDLLMDLVVLFLPFYFFFPDLLADRTTITVVSLATLWWTRLQHANLRLNFGPLRYLLVTPQSHRIHHSVDPVHYNSNYVSVFAWDRLFRTQHPDSDSYPPTGIGDPNYPEATSFSPGALLASLTGQLAYPFQRHRIAVATGPRERPIRGVPHGSDGGKPLR